MYIVYMLFISYKMHLVELCFSKELHCTVNISSARARRTAMQNINNYDWD